MPPSTGASSLLAPLNRLAGQIEGLLGQAEANIQRELDACKVKLSKTSEERDALEARRRETENALRVSEHALMLEQEARRRSEFAREIAEAALRTERNLRTAEQTKIAAERQRLAEIIERIPRALESRFSEISEEIGRIVDTNRPLPATTGRSELGVSQTAIQRTETQEGAPKRSDTSNNGARLGPAFLGDGETSSKRKRTPNRAFLNLPKGPDVPPPPYAKPNEVVPKLLQPDMVPFMVPPALSEAANPAPPRKQQYPPPASPAVSDKSPTRKNPARDVKRPLPAVSENISAEDDTYSTDSNDESSSANPRPRRRRRRQ